MDIAKKNNELQRYDSSNNDSDVEIRSEEFQEMLGIVPPWILRRGIITLSIIIFIILVGSAFFKYPDVIKTSMTLTGKIPPASIVSKTSGRLQEILVKDNELVKINDCLAIINNPAKREDILYLKKYISTLNDSIYSDIVLPPKNLRLGNIQTIYSSFYKTLFEYKQMKTVLYHTEKIIFMKIRIKQYDDYYVNLLKQQQIINSQHELNTIRYKRDSILIEKKVITSDEWENSQNQYLQSCLTTENLFLNLQNTKIQLTQINENMLDLEFQNTEKLNNLVIQLITYIEQLNTEIENWEQTYTLSSPINGKISFTTFWAENQNVISGEIVFNVISQDIDILIGKAIMPMIGSGKVKLGQKVNISFLNFPKHEFGIVKGIVSNISIVPSKAQQGLCNYIVEIALPNELITTYKKELPYLPHMEAQADIITEDISLLERLFMPIKNIFNESL